ncbi:MAG: PQQ-binding-like beta-propeller repeat protein, partial [Armatimonadota bacterium]
MPPMLPTAVLVRTRVLSLIASAFLAVAGAAVAGNADSDLARRILQAAGGRPGLVVHVGCGEGALTAALYQGGARLVHGLDPDPRNVRKAREYIRKRGMYGPVSVERLDGERLPYANGVVNLLVSEDLGGVRMREVRRVLAPEGVAYVKIGRKWTRNVKPRPGNVDEWTHFLHDASGNAVAHDEAVGPPRRLQWLAEPPHTRSHEHTPSINALVSAGGRIFYIADEGPISSVRLPPKWHVIARDAYNGVLLWQRSVATWYPHLINWGRTPLSLERRLVAVGDRVYVTLGYYEPLSALDAATGETVKVYEGTRGTEEVVWHEGMLLLAVRSVTDERIAEMRQFVRLAVQSDSPLYARESALPLVKEFFAAERKAEVRVVAVDADSGTILWSKGGAETAGLRALSLCASGNRAFYQRGQEVVCLDLRSGRRRWAASAPRLRLAWENTVICAGGKSVVALSADAGEVLWTQTPLLSNIRDAFVINGSLWLGGFKPWEGGRPGARRGPAWGPYFVTQRDLATGEVLKHIEPENPGHHHRCYLNKATDRYILGGRRGTEFIDLRTGEVLWNSFARGVCRYGVMPCNGLLYAPPHACGCYVSAKLIGFNALASDEPGAPAPTTEPPRLERGPAYDSASPETGAPSPHDWPTYRHDAERSGRAPTAVPPELHCVWRADVGGRLTSPTIARGKVFVASVDKHRVSAVDADSGRPVWDFIADGRVD